MLPAMYSGVSGLLTHQQSMNVIGNDIANVNTVGYKQSNVTFKEAYVNSLRTPAPGTPGQQLGLGVQMGGITRDFSGGALMQTGVSSNMGISGDGFFVVADGGGQQLYTRAGDFTMDIGDDGNTYLITPDGNRLQGVMGGDPPVVEGNDLEDIILDPATTTFNIALDGTIFASVDGAPPEPVGRVALATFQNPTGLQAIGSNAYAANAASGDPAFGNPGEGGVGQVLQGYLENSNVDLAKEFTDMIVTQRGFQANSRTISTSDDMLQELLMLKR